jgi:hypothetical protein
MMFMNALQPNTVLKKTEKGAIAIRDRDRSLGPRARTVLILVDGVKTAAQLSAVGQDAAQGMELIQQLLAEGWIEVAGSAATPAAAAPSSGGAAPVARAAPTRDLKLAIRAACRNLESFMGMGADPLSLQLEKCTSNKEFEAKVREIQQLLTRTHSDKRAADFASAALGA